MNWADCAALERDPRMAALFENLRDGVFSAEFVEIFPGMTTAHARLVLDHVARSRKISAVAGLVLSRPDGLPPLLSGGVIPLGACSGGWCERLLDRCRSFPWYVAHDPAGLSKPL